MKSTALFRTDARLAARLLSAFLVVSTALLLAACGQDSPPAADPRTAPAHVFDNGMEVRFGAESPQLAQIAIDTVRAHDMNVGVSTPAHVAASIVASESGAGPLYLFESQDVTLLYADYVKSGAALERSGKALARENDLFAHKIVPQKDVVDAENDQAQAAAERAQLESRLRAAGVDPAALKETPAGNVWMIADVPESQLSVITRGEHVALTCNSYPGNCLRGTIASIGEVIDPATRTAKVRIVLPNRDGTLRPGMFATATFDATTTRALSVPPEAVVHVQGKAYVFTQTAPGIFHRTEVHIGAETPEAYLVSDGLAANQCVACGGVMLLKGLSFGY